MRRRNVRQLYALYIAALFYTVFLTPNRYKGGTSTRINFIPLADTIRRFYERGNENFWPYYIGYWENILGNIVLFIPFGILLKCLYPHKRSLTICAYGCLLSVCIEILQLIFQVGVCDIDDVILNFAGVAAGIWCYRIAKRKKPGWFAALT